MISLELSSIQHNRAESARLATAIEEFQRRGGQVAKVSGFQRQPAPPRKDWIDPDTVLKRKPPALSRSERATLRKMANSL